VTFANDGPFAGLVLVRDIEFVSVCEHHALPFFGRAALGYVPGERLVGLSKLARAVVHASRRPQVQERLTAQLCDWMVDELRPLGAGVVVDASHTCMSMRGARAVGATTRTSIFWGSVQADRDLRNDILGARGALG
jgi:GTP cyclohydrolase IA